MSSHPALSSTIRLLCVVCLLAGPQAAHSAVAVAQVLPPLQEALPGAAELRARALDSFHKSQAARERYICRERIQNDEIDSLGRVKKTNLVEREIFYVNGFQVSQ